MNTHIIVPLAILLGALAPPVPTGADTAAGEAKKYAGAWEAKFDGTVFSVLKVQADGGSITGSLKAGNVGVDRDGNLISAEPAEGEYPLIGPRIANGALLFEWTDDSADEPLKFEFRLTSSGTGELKFLTTPGNARIKPFVYARVGESRPPRDTQR